MHLDIFLLCTQYCWHIHGNSSGIFTLLKFYHAQKKKEKGLH